MTNKPSTGSTIIYLLPVDYRCDSKLKKNLHPAALYLTAQKAAM